MTRDYAKPTTTKKAGSKTKTKKRPTKKGAVTPKAAPVPKNSSSNKFFHITLISLILGGFGFGLYKLAQVPDPTNVSQTTKPSEPKKQTKETKVAKEPKPEARFQFYDLLPNSEVDTDTVDAYTFKEKGISEEYQYMLQTGSFKSAKDAERQKATIAFQGLKAKVRAVKNAQGSTWHRVETGPFNSRSDMNAALDKLYAINIQPLVKKSKK